MSERDTVSRRIWSFYCSFYSYGYIYIYIYIYDLADGLSSNKKFGDTSLFSAVHNAITTAKELNNDLVKINRWAYQWKMNFKHS